MTSLPSSLLPARFPPAVAWRGPSAVAWLLLALVPAIALSVWRLDVAAEAVRRRLAEPIAEERLLSDWHAQTFAGVRRVMTIVTSRDPALTKVFANEIVASAQAIAADRRQLETLPHDASRQAQYRTILARRQAYLVARDAVLAARARDQTMRVDALLVARLRPAADAYLAALEAMQAEERALIDRETALVDHAQRRDTLLIAGLGGLPTAAALLLLAMTLRRTRA